MSCNLGQSASVNPSKSHSQSSVRKFGTFEGENINLPGAAIPAVALVVEIQTGLDAGSNVEDGPCFWTAWNNHREYLRRLSLIWMNVSASDAEDALSVATLRAFEKYKENAAQITNERAWFARLLHNICIDIHRANKRRSRLGDKIKEIVEIDTSTVENVELTPEAELLNSELGRCLVGAIKELPEKLKVPLVMRLVKGEEYDDIAAALNISNDNARKRVQQARSILRQNLGYLRDK
ncbi:RNA polymerase sigma factor [Sneathiella aquimaris]|uniref:RNA polymerase sigma factor n=1 Tax=Sneathiella aquimaris TaxID=2599305 RepID=UPI00146D8666|nr:RNA polymerase sigma factor [Sneathiella aquimaris]